MFRNPFLISTLRLPLFQAEGAAGAGDGGDSAAAAAAAAAASAGAAAAALAGDPATGAGAGKGGSPWWQSSAFSAEEQQWLTARGLTKDDPAEVMPLLVKGHRSAEQRLGKGIDAIMDRPAKDQKIGEWLRANAATLGLPDKEDGYAVQPPRDWPKDLPWDADFEARARKIAFEQGVPPDLHKAYVELYAGKMKGLHDAVTQDLAVARDKMMGELRSEWGDQTDARITLAKQGLQAVATQAGLGSEQLDSVIQLLSEKTGDAGVLKLFATLGGMMSEDSLKGGGRGGALAMTPAEARAELAKFEAPDGEYGKAFATNNVADLKRLAPRREMLTKLAAG